MTENPSGGTMSGVHLQAAEGRPGPSWHVFLPLFPLAGVTLQSGNFQKDLVHTRKIRAR